LRVFGEGGAGAGSQLCAEQLHLVVGGLGKEAGLPSALGRVRAKVGMFNCGERRVVALIVVECGEPEELAAEDVAACADAPGDLVVGRGEGPGGEDRDKG